MGDPEKPTDPKPGEPDPKTTDPKPEAPKPPDPTQQPEPIKPEGDPEPEEEGEETFDRARAMRTIKQQRDSERKLKAELKARDEELTKYKDSELSEKERSEKRIKELEGELTAREKTLHDALLKVAIADSKHKVASVVDTAVLLERAGLEYDEDGYPKEIEEKLDALLKEKPFLKAQDDGRPRGDSDAGRGAGGGKDLESMSADDHFKQTQKGAAA